MMHTTFTVFISIENIGKQTENLVLRKVFLNEKDAKRYYCNLQKVITEKGYIYSFSDYVHHIYTGSSTMYAAYYDSEMENDLTLTLERQSCNIDFDEKRDKVTIAGKVARFTYLTESKKAKKQYSRRAYI